MRSALTGRGQFEREQLARTVDRHCDVELIVVSMCVLAVLVEVEGSYVGVQRQNARRTRERGDRLIALVYIPDTNCPVVARRIVRDEQVTALALVLGEHFHFVYRIAIRVECASKLKIFFRLIKLLFYN